MMFRLRRPGDPVIFLLVLIFGLLFFLPDGEVSSTEDLKLVYLEALLCPTTLLDNFDDIFFSLIAPPAAPFFATDAFLFG